jgi:proline iminopeptidase
LKEIIQKLHSKKVILIGQSWGSILATLFAADNADQIDKMIFTCPGPVYPTHQNLANVQPPDTVHLTKPFYTNAQGNKKANNIRTKAMAFFATRFGRKIASDKEADEFATYLNYEVDKSTVCDTSNILKEDAGSGFYSSVMTFNSLTKTSDRRLKMQQQTTPILVMKGECDNQKWGFTNEYLELFKKSELKIIPGAGHFISVEQPQLYTKTILDFLNK